MDIEKEGNEIILKLAELKREEICIRCGMSKKELRKEGMYTGCESWGKYYGRHIYKVF